MYKNPLFVAKALLVLLPLLLVRPTMAQQARISGYMFGDAYAIASHDDPEEVAGGVVGSVLNIIRAAKEAKENAPPKEKPAKEKRRKKKDRNRLDI